MVAFIKLPDRQTAYGTYRQSFITGIPGWTDEGTSDPLYYISQYFISRGFDWEKLANDGFESVTLGLADTPADVKLLMFTAYDDAKSIAQNLQDQRDKLNNVSGFSNSRLSALAKEITGVSDVGKYVNRWVANREAYETTLYIQGTDADGNLYTASTPALRTAVQNHMNSGNAKFYFSNFVVKEPARIDYTVNGTVTFDDTLINDLQKFRLDLHIALTQVLLDVQRINTGVYDSDIYKRLSNKVPGIKDSNFIFTRSLAPVAPTLGTVTIKDRNVDDIQILTAGQGIVQTPQIVFTPDTGGAEALALIREGKLDKIRITKGGDYDLAPTASLINVTDSKTGDQEGLDGAVYVGSIASTGWTLVNETATIKEGPGPLYVAPSP